MSSTFPIKRISLTTDYTAPWEGIVFIHEVGSDELERALATCFPEYKNLRQRKHAAIIKFFERELSDMYLKNPHQHSVGASSTQVLPHVQSGSGGVLVDTQKPAQSQDIPPEIRSPVTSNASLAIQGHNESYTVSSMPALQPSYIDPAAATHSTQFVFNASDGRPMQPKAKRRMTTEERMEYKETRKRGACSDCKQKKGKCTHMTGIGNNAGSQSTVTERPKSKTRKLWQTIDHHRHDSVLTQQYDSNQSQSMEFSRRSSNTSRLSHSGSTSPLWLEKANEEPQSDTSRYVQSSYLSAPVPSFINNDQAPCWSDYPVDNQASFHGHSSFQPETTFQYRQDEPTYLEYPDTRVHETSQNASDPLNYSSLISWDPGQQPHPDNNGYT